MNQLELSDDLGNSETISLSSPMDMYTLLRSQERMMNYTIVRRIGMWRDRPILSLVVS